MTAVLTLAEELLYTAGRTGLVLDSDTGRFYWLDNCGDPGNTAIGDRTAIGVGCQCGEPRYGWMVPPHTATQITDLLASGDLALGDSRGELVFLRVGLEAGR